MRRSEANAIIRNAEAFLGKHGVALPPFAAWSPREFKTRSGITGIVAPRLGWDVTDFGTGDFTSFGLTLFTLRNGTIAPLSGAPPKTYAEKVLIIQRDQVTPTHTHRSKIEDIIHRGGTGRLVIKIGPIPEQQAGARTTTVWCDGQPRNLALGELLTLSPGESVTLTPGMYHSFWAEGGTVLAGEVSSTNDDANDNVFLEGGNRFSAIEEDESPYRLLVSDYPALENATSNP